MSAKLFITSILDAPAGSMGRDCRISSEVASSCKPAGVEAVLGDAGGMPREGDLIVGNPAGPEARRPRSPDSWPCRED
jgi:hypothetical protein